MCPAALQRWFKNDYGAHQQVEGVNLRSVFCKFLFNWPSVGCTAKTSQKCSLTCISLYDLLPSVLLQFDENIRILLGRYDLDQDLGEFLTERKALIIPEPEPDSDSNSERKDSERGNG